MESDQADPPPYSRCCRFVSIASLTAAAHFTGLISPRSRSPPLPSAPHPHLPPACLHRSLRCRPPLPKSRPETGGQAPRSTRCPPLRQAAAKMNGAGVPKVTHREDAGIDVIPPGPLRSRTRARFRPTPAAVPQAPVCHDCGTVEAVREIETKGEGTGLGAIAGGVIGGPWAIRSAAAADAVWPLLPALSAEPTPDTRSRKTYAAKKAARGHGPLRRRERASLHPDRHVANGDRVRLNNGAIVALETPPGPLRSRPLR